MRLYASLSESMQNPIITKLKFMYELEDPEKNYRDSMVCLEMCLECLIGNVSISQRSSAAATGARFTLKYSIRKVRRTGCTERNEFDSVHYSVRRCGVFL